MNKLDDLIAYLEPLAWMSKSFKNDLIRRFIVAVDDAYRRGAAEEKARAVAEDALAVGKMRKVPGVGDFTCHENEAGDREIRVRGVVIAGRRADGLTLVLRDGGRPTEFTRAFNVMWDAATSLGTRPVLNWEGTAPHKASDI